MSGTLAKQRVCVLDEYIHKHNLLAVKGKTSHRKSMLLWITYGHLLRAQKQTNKAAAVWKRWN